MVYGFLMVWLKLCVYNCINRNLTLKAPNTTIAKFAITADPDETAHNEPTHLDLQCLPSKV